jgi:hypothetical protein
VSYCSAVGLISWNLFGALALYSAFRSIPPGRWLLYTGMSAGILTGFASLVRWLTFDTSDRESSDDGKMDQEYTFGLVQLQWDDLKSVDPGLTQFSGFREMQFSKFGEAIVYHHVTCKRLLDGGEKLSFSMPTSFLWQDGDQSYKELASKELASSSDLPSWKEKELNQEYWGLFHL